MPYHPQRIWAGTQFIADLTEPATFDVPAQTPVPLATSGGSTDINGIEVTARLIVPVSSDSAHAGM